MSTKKTKFQKKSQSDAKLVAPLIRHPGDSTKWYEYQYDEKRENTDTVDKPSAEIIALADSLLKRDVELFTKVEQIEHASESRWLHTVASSGTSADKLSALSLQIQRSPVHALTQIDALVSIVRKKCTREAANTIGVLKGLFVEHLLPPNRKLIPWNELNKQHKGRAKEQRLIMWQFEHRLKSIYIEFVHAIERMASGNIEALCVKSLGIALDLISERPEQEQFLLSMFVNKLGHPNSKVASKVCNLLRILMQRQPNMRMVIVKEIERFIYRPNMSEKAQFYAVCLLTQTLLNRGESDLGVTLLAIYFGLFRILVTKKRLDSRLLTALITGTNRAFPYAKENISQLLAEIDTLYKIVAQAKLSASLQSLKLLYQVLDTSEGISDRYYNALYRKLFDMLHTHSTTHHRMMLNILSKAMTNDAVDRRVNAFIKRLLQVALHQSAAFATASLILVSRIVTERPSILRLTNATEKMDSNQQSNGGGDNDDDDEHYVDVHGADSDYESDEKVTHLMNSDKKVKKLSWVHRQNAVHRTHSSTRYDGYARNALFANADSTLEYELTLLAIHYHPTVAIFAKNILTNIPIRYDGDPLLDFTLMRFLDRFVYRNPKSIPPNVDKGTNVIKRAVRRKVYNPLGVKKLAVTSEEYRQKNICEVPPDEQFLHRYVTSIGITKKKSKKSADGANSDIESVNSDEFEEMLDRYEEGAGRKKSKEDNDDDDDDDDNDDDDDDDDEEEEEDDDDSDEDADGGKDLTMVGYSDSDDDGRQLDDVDNAIISADQFAELIETEGEAESTRIQQKKTSKKRKIHKARGFKRRKRQ